MHHQRIKFISTLFFMTFFFLLSGGGASAAPKCDIDTYRVSPIDTKFVTEGTQNVEIQTTIAPGYFPEGTLFQSRFESANFELCLAGLIPVLGIFYDCHDFGESAPSEAEPSGKLSMSIPTDSAALINYYAIDDLHNKRSVLQVKRPTDSNFSDYCELGILAIKKARAECEYVYIYQERNGQKCYWENSSTSCFQENTAIKTEARFIIPPSNRPYANRPIIASIGMEEHMGLSHRDGLLFSSLRGVSPGSYTLTFRKPFGSFSPQCSAPRFKVSNICKVDLSDCVTEPKLPTVIQDSKFEICNQISDQAKKAECNACATDNGADSEGRSGIWTAVGCIRSEPTALIAALVQLGLGIAGGVALLTILAAGFMLTTSQGEPKKAGEAKEMITAAVLGLLFIIFSVTILQFIGYNILKIPGFGG